MSTHPDELRADIERTRENLSYNVNALADSANPANMARRKVDKVKDSARDLQARVFGDPDKPWDDGAVGDVAARASAVTDDAADAVRRAPMRVRSSTRGNPLAAGLVAFGLGALVGGVLPSSEAEKELAAAAKDTAQPLIDEAKDMAADAVHNIQPVVEDAVEGVKEAASAAADSVTTQASVARDTVTEQARVSADEWRSDDSSRL